MKRGRGLGIKNLRTFNLALFEKWQWLLKWDHKVLWLVLKGKYVDEILFDVVLMEASHLLL